MAQAPDAWDYSLSDIPSPLTDEMEAAQLSKKVRACNDCQHTRRWFDGND
jgi:hypothetical protein